MSHTIRKATTGDIKAIQQMAEITFRHTYRNILTPEQMEYMMQWMYSDDSLAGQMADGHVFHIISTQEGRDIGYVSYSKESDVPTLFHLHKIYLLPDMQGLGLGAMLLRHAEKEMIVAAAGKPVRYELNVNRGNSAVTFYEHMGMRKDRQGDFDIGNGFYMNDYIMAKDIKPCDVNTQKI